MTRTEKINAVAAGRENDLVLYWANGDDMPSWRDVDGNQDGTAESGACEFVGWAGQVDGSEDDTYSIVDFFSGPDGGYRGPDCHGVYPIFRDA